MVWRDGGRYEGDFVNGARTGKGISLWASGERYEGDFVNDKRHGEGTMILPRGASSIPNYGDKGNFVGGKYVISGTWEKDKFVGGKINRNQQSTASTKLDDYADAAGITVRSVVYDFEQLRDYCAYAKLLVSQVPPALVEKYINDSTLSPGTGSEFEDKRNHEKYKSWIQACIKKAKIPGKTFTINVPIKYSGYDFSKKRLSIHLEDGTPHLSLPIDLINGWKKQVKLAGIKGEPFFGWSSGSNRNGFTTVGKFALYDFNAADVNVDQEEAEKFLKNSNKNPVPATLTFEIAGHYNNQNILNTKLLSVKLDSSSKVWKASF